MFDPDDDASALAELEERTPRSRRPPSPNAALRASARIVELLTTKDWPAFRALAADDFRFEDRRRHSLVSGDVEVYIRNLEVVSAWPGRKVERTVLATPRDEVSLERIHYTGGADGTEFEGEFLRLCEVDAGGRLRAIIHFDPDDAPEPVAANAAPSSAARADRDLARVRELLPRHFCFHGRRRTGARTARRRATTSTWLESLFAVPPDAILELERLSRAKSTARVSIARSCGTLAGTGEFENLVSHPTASMAARGSGAFELEDLAVARAPRELALRRGARADR